MTTHQDTPEHAGYEAELQAARALLDGRLPAVRELAAARRADVAAAAAAEAAAKTYSQARLAAIAKGWTEEELRKLGYPEPDVKRGSGRPPKTPARRPAPTAIPMARANGVTPA